MGDPPYHFDRGGTYFRNWFPELSDDAWPPIFAQLYRKGLPWGQKNRSEALVNPPQPHGDAQSNHPGR